MATYKDFIENKTSMELLDWTIKSFDFELPLEIQSADDLKLVTQLLSKLANSYSFVSSLLSYTKVLHREVKKIKAKSEESDDLIDKKEVLSSTLSAIELKHKTLSRMITARQEIRAELNMSTFMKD